MSTLSQFLLRRQRRPDFALSHLADKSSAAAGSVVCRNRHNFIMVLWDKISSGLRDKGFAAEAFARVGHLSYTQYSILYLSFIVDCVTLKATVNLC